MIEIKDLRKSYKTGDFVQRALDGVTLTFRDNEFVAVLGPSGSGKTTLLNILGGLDHADSGDIVINGISTKDYRSKDWDTYRNHRIGFIFQSYNLIPHQSVLSNVELALTLAGVSHAERKRRASEALVRVGLGDHLHKRPNQLSGGQMQRVAIARALVNDPDIVLADEPTGALDTETGLQVMGLLKEIADDRLVIMVTHNPDLADEYATRIVNLADGRIVGDSDPFLPGAEAFASATAAGVAAEGFIGSDQVGENLIGSDQVSEGFADSPREAGEGFIGAAQRTAAASADTPSGRMTQPKHASMSFLTALALSFNNLMTKKGRTFLTAFAGSIGIIGIASILSLSTGVNNYIADTEGDALTSYPLTITKSSFDMTSLMTASIGSVAQDDGSGGGSDSPEPTSPTAKVIPEITIMSDMFAQVKNNNLSAFRDYLVSDECDIDQYVNTISYDYGITPLVYKVDTSDGVKRLNPSSMSNVFSNGLNTSSFMSSAFSIGAFQEMLDNQDLIQSRMDVVAGRWAENYDEAVLVLSRTGRISDYMLYSIGVYDTDVMTQMTQDALNGKEVVVPEISKDFTYDDALNLVFSVVPSYSLYQYNESQEIWAEISDDSDIMKQRVEEGIKLKVVGVVQPKPESTNSVITQGIAYTPALTRHLIEIAGESEIVQQQKNNPDVDVFTGKTFEELQSDDGKTFDMESMFTVDEDKLSSAFGFDTSALSGMDFSGIDLSGVDMSGMKIDPDSMKIDPTAMSSLFSEDSIRQIMANAPKFTLEASALVDETTKLTEEQQKAINTASAAIQADFTAWSATSVNMADFMTKDGTIDYTALFQAYSADMQAHPEKHAQASQAMAGLQESLGGTAEALVNNAMQNYMQNQFAPYLAKAMQALMQQAAQMLATQIAQAMTAQITALTNSMGSQLSSAISGQLQSQMGKLQDAMQNGFSFDAEAFAGAIQFNMTQDDLTSLLTSYMNSDKLTYDSNMSKLGFAELNSPESISIYPIDFPAKESVIDIIKGYNDKMEAAGDKDASIQYSDIAGALMTSVTSIVDTISLVLIAFVAISLVVSSIMIGIITYISVLERKKEIGILRAMGASKLNIANVFNAETVIEGLISGVLAIAVVYLASMFVNPFVYAGWDVPNVMTLPPVYAAILVGISVLLTFIAGLLPSSAAANRDPVEALRSE